ncbi:MAG: UdgX family uracil-DNA binding protein [Acidisphaera sp.]|nr:UdgX family uracil-DNA binding protein [Acidisphaera sp.]
MHVVLAHETDFAGWRTAARSLAPAGVQPQDVVWSVREGADLLAVPAPPPVGAASFSVPRALLELAETAVQARDPERFALLYTLLFRVHAGERHLLDQATDPTVHRVSGLARSVRRDTDKMRAFLRFREVVEPEGTRHVGWFEPEHYILEANAPFFVRRFATMLWSILTPYRSAHWDGETLSFGPGADRTQVPDDDALEAYWRAYYRSIFNPARLKVAAMTSEMPRKYWKNLPEAAAIPTLIRTAQQRTAAMVEQTPMPSRPPRKSAPLPVPEGQPAGLAAIAQEAARCRRCPLWERATQTVFGEGARDAAMMLVGEQPGDQEDLAGRPFVGPAGQLLDRALQEAGIDRTRLYVTNAVKHFKFEPRGKRRIHQKPDSGEIAACKFWLDQELAEVSPRLTVLLGASAARAVLGRAVTIWRERGRAIPLSANATAFVTVHPSFLLRLPDEAAKRHEYAAFVRDLREAARLAG